MGLTLGNVYPEDVQWIDQALGDWYCSQRWSFNDYAPWPEVIREALWLGVTAQRVARTDGGVPVALMQLTGLDLERGVAELDALACRDHSMSIRATFREFLAVSFRDFPLRRISLIVVDGDMDVSACLGPIAAPVGRLLERQRRAPGRYADVELFEVSEDSVWP
jgi:hypothetical protein